MTMSPAAVVRTPRLYSLLARHAGPADGWSRHLGRARAMGFDWLHLDHVEENGALAGVVAKARGEGLSAVVDLVIDRMDPGAPLVAERPAWFRPPSSSTRHGPATSPLDPRPEAGLPALVAYDRPELREEQVAHWRQVAQGLVGAGAKGLLCRRACTVPPSIWGEILAPVRAAAPGTLLIADTLGADTRQVLALAGSGFDYLLSSARWWDLRQPWLLEQDAVHRQVAPSIAFPEWIEADSLVADHDDLDAERLEALYRQRYLLAVAVASGLLMPMGYERGARRPNGAAGGLDQANAPFDIAEFVAAANALKTTPALALDGPQRRVTAPDGRLTGHLRLDAGDTETARSATITLWNGDPARAAAIEPGTLIIAAGGRFGHFAEVTPGANGASLQPGAPVTLDPFGCRIFRAEATPVQVVAAKTTSPSVPDQKLAALAADRVAIERVQPKLDGGRFPVKRVVGDLLEVTADIFCDGHDRIAACLKYQGPGETEWHEVLMRFVDNDRWAGAFPLLRVGRHRFTIEGWRDLFAYWQYEVVKKRDAGVSIALEMIEGRGLVERAAEACKTADAEPLRQLKAQLAEHEGDQEELLKLLLSEPATRLMARAGVRVNLSRYERELEVWVDRTAAAFAAWYELFPRSQSDDPARHGTFDDVIEKLPYVRDMGFDTLYFPPIHPIGKTNRKGRNNTLNAGPDDPGSPYGIGAAEGGHTAIHPELGTADDFKRLVAAAHEHGLEIALDFALNSSPDHPWIKEHRGWFEWRPDGTIKYAENPPKKYEDIVNFHYYDEAFPSLWYALRDAVLFWVGLGVKVFRVDNPHTKPLPFWEWLIREVQDRDPGVLFLSEAFTRPKMMKRLAKVGFTQSYSYFTWRNTKAELTEYLTELTTEGPQEYMRPNFFANTPDINPDYLQTSGRPGFQVRAVLASTLSSVYGIYSGFELCEGAPDRSRKEYASSEKYEIKAWDWDRPGNIRDYITRLNAARRDNPALWRLTGLRFFNAWDENILYYAKMTPELDNVVLIAVNLDPHRAHGCYLEVPLWELGLSDDASIDAVDLLDGHRFTWRGKTQYVWLDPLHNPCAIWRLVPPAAAV